jgi:hypothetical protein
MTGALRHKKRIIRNHKKNVTVVRERRSAEELVAEAVRRIGHALLTTDVTAVRLTTKDSTRGGDRAS